ncbi:MAG: MFS transporter, partial [Candidatus Dormibacteraeota bacterium]|nr:MFS transporter [Candidatus Dormibacteraeota bacterium]
MAETTVSPDQLEQMTPEARKAAIGAFLGLGIDFYDIYLPIVAITPALIYFVPTTLPAPTRATIAYIIFAVTLIGRPIGSVIFGHFGDVIGRKRTTMIAVGGLGVMTFLIALLPGYATLGFAAVALFILLRLIGGIFMGGEYASANPLAMEACPRRLRGIVGGVIQAAYPIAYIAISLVTAIMLLIAPAGKLNSAYVQWGWRIPFLIGSLLAFLFLIYYNTVSESKLWQETAPEERIKAPLKEVLKGRNLRNLAQVFLMMSGLWFSLQAAISTPPALLITVLKQPSQAVTNGILVANIFLAIGYIVVALLAQRYGRRLLLIVSGLWTVVLSSILYYLMVANVVAKGAFVLTMVTYTALLVLTIAPWGIVTTYINERFPTGVRASGYGIGYSLAVIIPSFYSFYLL